MMQNCAKSCGSAGAKSAGPSIDIAANFYEIQNEKDGNGNTIDFESFKGKVVYVVNVASYCGYTAGLFTSLGSLL